MMLLASVQRFSWSPSRTQTSANRPIHAQPVYGATVVDDWNRTFHALAGHQMHDVTDLFLVQSCYAKASIVVSMNEPST